MAQLSVHSLTKQFGGIVALEDVSFNVQEGEILGLRWADILWSEHVARLPRTKNGDARMVPLTEEAEKALKAPIWWRKDKTYVFPGKDGQGHLGHVSHAFHRLAARAARMSYSTKTPTAPARSHHVGMSDTCIPVGP